MSSTPLITAYQTKRPGLLSPKGGFTLTQRVNSTVIEGDVHDELFRHLKKKYTVWAKTPNEIRLFGPNRSRELVIYSGLTQHLIRTLNRRGYDVTLIDNRPRVGKSIAEAERLVHKVESRLKETCGYELYSHQREAIRIGLINPFGAFQIATGGGKTLIIASLLYAWDMQSMLLVDSIELMNQAYEELQLLFPKESLAKFGAGVKDQGRITVGIVWSVTKHRKILDGCKYMVIDEAHLAAAKTFRRTIAASKPCCRHGFTATYTRTMKGEVKVLYAVTGDRLLSIPPSELIDDGVLAQPKITMIDLRGIQTRQPELPQAAIVSKYIVENRLRNRLACKYVFSHYEKNRTILVFVTRVKHGKLLKDMLVQEFGVPNSHVQFISGIQGNKGKEIRQAAINGLKDRSCPILIATKIFEKGINIPSVDVGVNMKGEYGDIGCKQSLGRILRGYKQGGSKTCHYIDFYDSICGSLKAHSRRRLRNYRQESGFMVRVIHPDVSCQRIGVGG